MKSVKNLASIPVGKMLLADDITEFHAARLLMLIHLCGTNNNILGLTKWAKLDFFVRYPAFFQRIIDEEEDTEYAVESHMVRHHYGPWDSRYYQVLAYLEAKGLVDIVRGAKGVYEFTLSEQGISIASQLSGKASFEPLTELMKKVKRKFGKTSGNHLKELIYLEFDREIGSLPIGRKIQH